MQSVRIDTSRLIRVIGIWLVAPMVGCIILDVSLGLLPFLTLSGSILVLPVASIMVMRATLFEFDKVIQKVAPDDIEDIESDEAVVDETE